MAAVSLKASDDTASHHPEDVETLARRMSWCPDMRPMQRRYVLPRHAESGHASGNLLTNHLLHWLGNAI